MTITVSLIFSYCRSVVIYNYCSFLASIITITLIITLSLLANIYLYFLGMYDLQHAKL